MRPGTYCDSAHQLLIEKYRLKLKKLGKTTRPARYQFSSVPKSCPSLCDPMDCSNTVINSWSLLKLMPIELVMPSNHLILCHSLLLLPSIFPASESFQMSQLFASGGQSIGVSASASVLPMNIQD